MRRRAYKISKETENITKSNGGGVTSTYLLAEGLELKLKISKQKKYPSVGTFRASIHYKANGKKLVSLTFRVKDCMEAIQIAMRPILFIAPNLTQKELDNHYKIYPCY